MLYNTLNVLKSPTQHSLVSNNFSRYLWQKSEFCRSKPKYYHVEILRNIISVHILCHLYAKQEKFDNFVHP